MKTKVKTIIDGFKRNDVRFNFLFKKLLIAENQSMFIEITPEHTLYIPYRTLSHPTLFKDESAPVSLKQLSFKQLIISLKLFLRKKRNTKNIVVIFALIQGREYVIRVRNLFQKWWIIAYPFDEKNTEKNKKYLKGCTVALP